MPSNFEPDFQEPVEIVSNRLHMFGCPARVLVELDLGNGATAQVPIGENCVVISPPAGYAELRVPFHGKILQKVTETLDQYEHRTGRSIR